MLSLIMTSFTTKNQKCQQSDFKNIVFGSPDCNLTQKTLVRSRVKEGNTTLLKSSLWLTLNILFFLTLQMHKIIKSKSFVNVFNNYQLNN